MCTVLHVHHSGYYQWLKQPESNRARENKRLTALIKESWLESGGIYGSPRIHIDLREAGETCSENRVARLMNLAGLKAIRGYKAPRYRAGKPAAPAKNQLQREFTYDEPNKAWVTDITYIRTYEGFLYLAVVLDLYSRRVIGWSMKATLAKEIVLDALLMAVWRRKPKQSVIIHSDQGSQFSSDEWKRFLDTHKLSASMSRRGNCWDNAVAESFFSSLKKEQIKRRIYTTRDEARSDIFEYIEVFYNRRRRHSHLGQLSPADYEEKANLNEVNECL